VIGHVYASILIAGGNGATTDHPLANVTITVDGQEETLRATTDALGAFSLNPCPAGRFFVKIDGRTASGSQHPSGAFDPFVGKPWDAVAGRTNNLAGGTGVIYLPLIAKGTLHPVSLTADTTITFPPSVLAANPALAGVFVTIPPARHAALWRPVKPFALTSAAQFRPPGPPALDSPRYAQDYALTRSLGERPARSRRRTRPPPPCFGAISPAPSARPVIGRRSPSRWPGAIMSLSPIKFVYSRWSTRPWRTPLSRAGTPSSPVIPEGLSQRQIGPPRIATRLPARIWYGSRCSPHQPSRNMSAGTARSAERRARCCSAGSGVTRSILPSRATRYPGSPDISPRSTPRSRKSG
jgi:hypothetical protein